MTPTPVSWFEQLFGFPEEDYATTQSRFEVSGTTLRSMVNGREFTMGTFETPTLASLRARVGKPPGGTLVVTHEAIGDVLSLHALPENRGAMFQVASQFNCLEFAGPKVVPEDGVTGYAFDRTQGPACSLAAAAATVYRNYFAPVNGIAGQTRGRQLDGLDELAARLGAPGEFWNVVNGYTHSDEARLARLKTVLAGHDREELLGAVKIGLQSGTGVDFRSRFEETTEPTHVSQAFCSALSCGYTNVPLDAWEPLATIALDAAYEATLLAALTDEHPAPLRTVWLTFIGGGVFGNRMEWIAGAIGRALKRVEGFDLHVRIAHYRNIDEQLVDDVECARGRVPHRMRA